MQHTTIAVDLAKSVFQVAVSHQTGRVDEEHRLTRARFLRFFAKRPAATVLFEACGSAHHWARTLEQLGHTVRLLPPHETRRYVRRNKTDRADAKALLEAARNEEIHPVPVKSVAQQAIASLHRVRTTWVKTRTARLNTLRGLLREFGVTIPVAARHVVPQVRALIEDAEAAVPMTVRPSLDALCDEIRTLERRIHDLERQLAALVACVGDVRRFPSARHFASYLGLTPREHSSGTRRHLGAISKQGDRYLRTLLMHGARAVLSHSGNLTKTTPFRTWTRAVAARRGTNIATAAIANRLARMVWRVWRDDRPFVAETREAA